MTVVAARAFASNSRQRQAAIRNAQRKRRRSLAAIPRLHQRRLFESSFAPVAFGSAFPAGAGSRPITFGIELAVTSSAPSGVIFNVGDGDPALSVYFEAGELRAIVGSGSVAAESVAGFGRTYSGSPSVPNLVSLVVSVRPGDGHLRIWDEHGLVIARRSTLPLPAWADAGDVVGFGVAGGFNAQVTSPGAPVGFVARGPVRSFSLLPHRFLSGGLVQDGPGGGDPPAEFDEFLFRGTFVNNQIALYPLLDDSEVGGAPDPDPDPPSGIPILLRSTFVNSQVEFFPLTGDGV